MKTSLTFYVLVLSAASLVPSAPFVTFAQQNSGQAEAVVDAERDALKYADSGHWFLMGCILQGNSVQVDESISLPPTRLLGKSPEYIRFYAAAYSKKVKKIRTNNVRVGSVACCISYYSLVFLFISLELDQ